MRKWEVSGKVGTDKSEGKWTSGKNSFLNLLEIVTNAFNKVLKQERKMIKRSSKMSIHIFLRSP